MDCSTGDKILSQNEKGVPGRTATATIAGEHGVGKQKRPWLVDEVGDDAVELGQRIKFALDPHGIFNPGCVFEEAKA